MYGGVGPSHCGVIYESVIYKTVSELARAKSLGQIPTIIF